MDACGILKVETHWAAAGRFPGFDHCGHGSQEFATGRAGAQAFRGILKLSPCWGAASVT